MKKDTASEYAKKNNRDTFASTAEQKTLHLLTVKRVSIRETLHGSVSRGFHVSE
jgi:hypothetical protein